MASPRLESVYRWGSTVRVGVVLDGDMNTPHICGKSPMVEEMEPGTYWWCSCGYSATQPFCDGSHKGRGFTPVKMEITEKKKVAWCMCKHTANPPSCDGSHAKLA